MNIKKNDFCSYEDSVKNMNEYIEKSEIENLYCCFLKIIEEQKEKIKDSLDLILLNGVKTGMDMLIKGIREVKCESISFPAKCKNCIYKEKEEVNKKDI